MPRTVPGRSQPPATVAYLVNQYPQVSHSFIRREIRALERQGLAVERYALRGWDAAVADPEDEQERERTRYLLQAGAGSLIAPALAMAGRRPRRFAAALRLALVRAGKSERPLPYHLAYLAEACRLLPWLQRCGAVHLHAHFGTNAAEVAMLARCLGGPPYSFTVHGPEEFDRPQSLGLAEKAARAAFVVAVSAYGRGQLYRWLAPADWPKVQVVHCGLDAAFRGGAVPPPAAPRLVCVGRLCRQKGQLLLLEALHRLQAQGVACELVLAGDGELRGEIEGAIARLGLGARVRITGWIGGAQVREQILAARALVLPSFAEGLPLVLMEAMALRRPVLATWVAGIPELVLPGETGWLFPAGSPEALAAALADCLAQPAEALQRMGEAACRRVWERHCADTEAAKLAALFAAAAWSETPAGAWGGQRMAGSGNSA